MKKFLFKLFKKDFSKWMLQQTKPKQFEKLEPIFFDSNGRNYYRFSDEMDMGIERNGQILKHLGELGACISGSEFELIFSNMKLALEKSNAKGNMQPDIAHIGHLIHELIDRRAYLIHPEILFAIISVTYIREDENPYEFDEHIQSEKIEQFRKDAKGGLYDFFAKAGIERYLPLSDFSTTNFQEFLEMCQARITALERQMKAYILKSG